MIFVLFLILSFFVGGIPFGYLMGKLVKGIDLREFGSKNIGATNAGRVLGWRYGILVLILDAMKGAVPVFAFLKIDSPLPQIDGQLIVGSIAILGHTFTPFLSFKGGKGVATALGVYLYLFPVVTVSAVLIFFIVYKLTGYVSLGSIVGSFAMPVWYYIFYSSFWKEEYSLSAFLALVVTFVLIVFLHRENLKRLIAGKELRATNAN